MNPHPFLAPRLPEGFGFAIVDRDGNVLFHSENSRNLSENLFDESEDSPEVRLAAEMHGTRAMPMSYLGNDYTAALRPLQQSGEWIPWSVFVFRDRYVLRALNSDTLLGGTVMFGLYLGLIVGALILLQLVDRRYHMRWLWPDRRRSSLVVYALVAGALVGTGVTVLSELDGVLATHAAVAPAVVVFSVAAACLALGASRLERLGAGVAATVDGMKRLAPLRGGITAPHP